MEDLSNCVMQDSLPVLMGRRVLLREPREDDAVPLYEFVRDPEVTRFLAIDPPASPDDTRFFIEKCHEHRRQDREYVFVIADVATDRADGCHRPAPSRSADADGAGRHVAGAAALGPRHQRGGQAAAARFRVRPAGAAPDRGADRGGQPPVAAGVRAARRPSARVGSGSRSSRTASTTTRTCSSSWNRNGGTGPGGSLAAGRRAAKGEHQ